MDKQKQPISEFAVASLVLGIMQFIHIFNVEKALLAIGFGIFALKKIGQGEGVGGKKFAISGIVLGIIGVVATVVMTIIFWPQMQEMMQRQSASGPGK